MAKISIPQGATSVSVNIFIADSSSTVGAGLSGLLFNTAGLTAYYMRPRVAATAITLATLAAVTSAYSSGGFKEIDATNAKGWYRFDIPDAVLANAERFVDIHFQGAANMAPLPIEIELTGWNNQDAVRGGMTALPNAVPGASGGLHINGSNSGTTTYAAMTITGALVIGDGVAVTRSTTNGSAITATGNGTGHGAVFTSGSGATGDGVQATAASSNGNGLKLTKTGTGQDLNATTTSLAVASVAGSIGGDVAGKVLGGGASALAGVGVQADVEQWKGVTAPANTGDAFARLGAPAGASVSADVAAVKSDTGNLITRIPSALFSGITSLAQWLGLLAGKQTGNSTARTELRATGAGSGTFDETTDSQEALRDRGDAAWVTASGFATPSDVPSVAAVADAVWDEALSGHTTAGSAGKALSDAGAGGTPPTPAAIADAVWDEAMSGHTTPGSAGADLAAAGSAGDPWATSLPGAYGVGTAGKIVGTNLDGTVSSRSQPGDIMKVSTGSGANQLDVTNGVVKANLAQILGTTLTETAGQIAAAFKKFYDIASPTSTINRITLVDTVSTLTNAPSDSSGVTALLAKFTGMTSLAQWLGAAFGKQTPNATAQTEIRATGAGAGTFDATTDSQEALRDRGDAAWITGPAPLDAAGTRTALGMASANLDTQLAAKAQPGDAMALVVNALDAAAVAPSGAAEIAAAGGTPQTGDVYGLLTSAQAEPTTVPAANATPMQKWAFMFTALRNKRTTTATQDKVLADDGATTVATSPLADDGTTFTRGKYV